MSLTAVSIWKPNPGAADAIQARVDAAVAGAVADWSGRVLGAAQAIVPVRTGELRDSGHVETDRSGKVSSAETVFDAPHAVYVEFGTGIRGAASPGAGPGPYSSTWPGMPAQPYLRPAFDGLRNEAEPITQAAVTAALS